MGNTNNEDAEEMTVELELEDGAKVVCAIITILTVQEKDYIVLLPLDENDPDEEPELSYIEDDEEYEAVADAFDEYLDAQEFDELVEEEESKL